MSFCLTELHLWSLKNTLHIGDGDIGVYQYYDKKETVSPTKFSYLEDKQQLAESRDYPWILKNKRPEKLRDTLKELEELMQNSQCVLSKWKNKYFCQLLFGSGVLVSLSLSGPQLEKVVIDRTLVGKLISDTISDAVLTDNFIILSFLEQNKLCFIQFTKKAGSPDLNKRMEKLSTLDCKISYHEIPGPVSRRIERHLAINSVQDMVICWWPTASDDAWPWSPISSEKDRANLLLLGCAYGRLEVLSYIRTEWNPLDASFSTNQPYQVHTVEHSISVDKEPMADSCVYECVRNKIQCVAITRIPLRSKAISCCRNISEDKLILGCEDSSVILYEANRRVTLLAQAELLPTLLSCHPEGALILVGSSQGELQIFDTALSPIKVQLLAEDCSPEDTLQFSRRFEVSHSLVQIQWTVPQCANDVDIHDLLFLRFDKGPIGVLLFKLGVFTGGRLGLVEIINQYIRYDEIDEAINILSTMSWDAMGHQCFISMSAIVNHLLRQKFTLEREAQLEASLGTFYAPTRPLSDTAVLEFRDPISRYARRFFHYLLRHHRFEKAFLLAMDIGARDLFMDIHYLALDKGELALAEVAKKRANDIDAESITTGVELLGPLDGGDRLTAAFDGLSLSPQAEEKHPENFPLPGPDGSPISHCPSLDSSFQRPTYSRQVADKEHEPEKDIYASSLMDKRGVGWNSGGDLGEDYLEEETGDGGSLRMVHFGLV
ncbi:WD repeat-containing and planar cell polarity effector protein fritz homolog isoform X1 [Ornithorhynchus anatinus]|uniref:WD repeat-containing and planar cell polarity effector protein fritz homolog isoform X1 n=1 Tax=Ornithorhynchus anatinus TaxID=9258 RepID=UPI0004545F92|nr:WD repeat-containing and planar cell polarity effector protein fritz homolog isoform X1 [Ornithorhynchus anatinus]XP_028928010.1 WD repeat-containing and planar cell polarity effector protein fritz homolog isoform X1 [Ornithorhynchus anatinus]XP_028928011.1 WD repeat-containing and planar cell polarity effector protein fritz homolog isoform X1 [Ornithorhynchus anatinus]XP_028928012.1 WD repeat-containing and planar cell polarity effector protein fritz homolog isoform X1 [Ornithorhynchus anati